MPLTFAQRAAASMAWIMHIKPGNEGLSSRLLPYVRDPVFEHCAPLEVEAECFKQTGLIPKPDVGEWLDQNVIGVWTTYLTPEFDAMIAFELEDDCVLYCIAFPQSV